MTVLTMLQNKIMKITDEFCREKNNSIAGEYGKTITQVSCDKCFYVATNFSAWNKLKQKSVVT